MNRFDEDHLGETWFHVMLVGLVAFIAVFLLFGCARGYGPGPSSDGEQQEIERIKRERGATKIKLREAEENLKHINPMGGG